MSKVEQITLEIFLGSIYIEGWTTGNIIGKHIFKLLKKLDISISSSPVDTGCKLNVHKTFRGRPGRLLNILCTFNLRPVSTGSRPQTYERASNTSSKTTRNAAVFKRN